MTQAPSSTLVADARDAVMALAPEGMRAQFGVMVELALSAMPAELLSKLIDDLQSAHNEDGTIDVDKLIAVGKGFGLTDEMIDGYKASYGALSE